MEITNLYKRFKTKKGHIGALKNINLKIILGDFICLVGPSGCGKSTLLKLIAGLLKPDQGEINIKGKIGYMFQEPGLFPWLKVKDNVGFGLKMENKPKEKIKQLVDKHLELVHLQQFGNAYPHELSGGMKQRVALARTLILNPDILLMDEPFAALDAQTREILYKDLQEIWRITKKTIIFVTHNVREAVCLGNRIEVFTARPGTIKKEFMVHLPRPRDLGNLELIKISNLIMDELKIEIQKVIAEMQIYKNNKSK